MASRIMHYLISDLISKTIHIGNFNRFVIGSLAPDMSSHEDMSSDIAHFKYINEEKQIKGINWIEFSSKYKQEILNDDFYLGYYIHLITDAIWFKNIADKYIRIYPKEIKKEYILKGYRDFQKLNTLLIKKYGLKDFIQITDDINIDEVKSQYIIPVYEAFKEDFKCKTTKDLSLELFKLEDINEFINQSVEICINEIQMQRVKGVASNPEQFYSYISR